MGIKLNLGISKKIGLPDSGFAQWNDLQTAPYNEHEQRETTTQPIVVPWNQFKARVAEQKRIRDSLRHQGFCFWPWVIADWFKIGWDDFSQGSRGSCAGWTMWPYGCNLKCEYYERHGCDLKRLITADSSRSGALCPQTIFH